jgi:hypothetical protein
MLPSVQQRRENIMQTWTKGAGILCLTLIATAWIASLPKQRVGSATQFFNATPAKLREAILDVQQQPKWRKEVAKVELTQTGWTEHLKSGEQIVFQLTINEPDQIQLHFRSPYGYSGTWHAQLIATGNGTQVNAEESVTLESISARVISHLFVDPEKIAQTYLNQLQAHLGEKP